MQFTDTFSQTKFLFCYFWLTYETSCVTFECKEKNTGIGKTSSFIIVLEFHTQQSFFWFSYSVVCVNKNGFSPNDDTIFKYHMNILNCLTKTKMHVSNESGISRTFLWKDTLWKSVKVNVNVRFYWITNWNACY